VVAWQQQCLVPQTLLEHVMRDLRPDQRALKRLAALPGEENRAWFTNMIKVCNLHECCRAQQMPAVAVDHMDHKPVGEREAFWLSVAFHSQYLEEKGRAGVIDLPGGTMISVGAGALRRAYLIPPSRAICETFAVQWDPPDMLLILIVPAAEHQ